MLRNVYALILALFVAGAAGAAEPAAYDISLRYNPASAHVNAVATIALKAPATSALTFYLHDELVVKDITVGGKALRFAQKTVDNEYSYDLKANQVVVELAGQSVSGGLRVVYEGRFSPSKARSPSDYMRGDKDGLFLRAYAYSMWFPTFEGPNQQPSRADYTVHVTAPSAFRSVFVGQKLDRTEKDGWASETWVGKDIGGFDPQMTIRRFHEAKIGPITAYYLEDAKSVAAAERIAALSERLLAYFRTHYRAAAADRPIYVVQEPEFGDIASNNVIGVQDKAWRAMTPESWEAETLAHELVHAFVQTPTPVNDPFYAFSYEAFPSYFHLPALASVLGEDFYEKRMDRVQKRYLERRASGKDLDGNALPPEKPILSMSAGDIGVYKDTFVLNDRALLCLDHLRRQMGRPGFDDLVRELTARPSVMAADFFAVVAKRAPGEAANAHLWLETKDFPGNFRRPVKE